MTILTNGVTNGKLCKEPVDISVALRPNDPERVPSLIEDISVAGNALNHDESAGRLRLLEKARDLVRALETPRETMIKHLWAQPSCLMALTIGVNTGLFHLLAKDGGCAKKADDMAKTLGIQPALLCRLLRHVAAMGYIVEVAADEYKPTNFAKSLTIPSIGDGYPCVLGGCLPALVSTPPWLADHQWQAPNDVANGPYQAAHSTPLNFFEWLQAHPPYGMQFNHHMGGYRQGRPSWMDPDFYPVQDRLITGMDTASPDSALLVDIGGGLGHDLDEFRRKHPTAPGRLILQDLAIVADQIRPGALHASVEVMAYDFHTEQPVVGARAYYMHSVLHDWPDEVCGSILARVAKAMRPGYSRLLINENVIPGTGADWQATALDLMVLSLLSARERTEADWRRLLGGAGLRVVGIWSTDKQNGVESLIECELA
ncbi:Demethylsterigmatocystin 6-O-methyltransferase [Parachaetomium inaequale]|uniref:Demethylsterigmatocystin 6-O-methyltransferase n=1 Tax=Parachaetomium inaequale TaxID=2588326 RepID=A0AAN6SMY4_9PEZI|nr:Demethylsterigmatocystin 6-O-methyltransferase [Parachaetomium inaequale]